MRKSGTSLWNSFVYSEAYTIAKHGAGSNNSPYGLGDDGLISDYISLAESWAEHVGQTFTDRMYGLNSTLVFRQGLAYANNDFIPGSSHINYLEDFSPFRTNDPFRWIPDGLYYDLIDNRNDAASIPLRVDIDDEVFGYTNQQLFNALDADVTSLIQYRIRFLNENGNNQAFEVTQLFNRYGY
ncbi:MAG: hypothetical protein M3Y85_03730 [Bacteroidota bacterium]|nr:hypothetical protein [Bacteroidota bacterium]